MSLQTSGKSFFGENFSVKKTTYSGKDFSRVACVFPGQGSLQLEELAKELKQLPICLDYLRQADVWAELKGYKKISSVLGARKEIPPEQLHFYQNLFLFSISVGLYRSAIGQGRSFDLITAHSFGEYAALVCAGVLSFEAMLDVVAQRELLSPKDNEVGTLFALSMNANELELKLKLKKETVFEYVIANVNSSKQTVIAIAKNHIQEAQVYFKKNRIPAIELTGVARPYHSHWMKPTAKELKKWFLNQEWQIQAFTCAFVSSVQSTNYKVGDLLSKESLSEILSAQLTSPVLFQKQIETAYTQNIYSFLELGFSGIYTRFIEDILLDQEHSCQTMRWLSRTSQREASGRNWTIDVQNSPFLGVLKKYIGKVTGYELVDIQVYDQFQEDLRIDSIKKAEIVFRTLEELNMNIDESLRLAQLRSVGDIVDFLESLKKRPLKNKKSKVKKFVPLTSVWRALPDHKSELKSAPGSILGVDLSGEPFDEEIIQKLRTIKSSEILMALNLSEGFSTEKSGLDFIKKWQKIATELSSSPAEINLILLGSLKMQGPMHGVNAFLKSLCKEQKWGFRSVVYDQQPEMAMLLQCLKNNDFTVDFKFTEGRWFSKGFDAVKIQKSVAPELKPWKRVAVIGGHRGLAFELLKKQAFPAETEIFIMGRSHADSPQAQEAVQILKSKYKIVQYESLDARNEQKMFEYMSLVSKNHGALDLIVNSAGVEFSRKLTEKEDDEIKVEFETKFLIPKLLKKLKKEFNFKIIHFSSVAAEFGNAGQTVYAFGSATPFADPEDMSILWPPLDRVGMTENVGILMRLKETGLALLPIEKALTFFKDLLLQPWVGSSLLYCSPKDLALFDYDLVMNKKIARALGIIVDPVQMILMKTFSREDDRYVFDHVIESMPVIPAAYQMAAMLTLGKFYFKNFPMITNFSIKNIMLMMDSEELRSFNHLQIQDSDAVRSVVSTQMEHFVSDLKYQVLSKEKWTRSVKVYNHDIITATFYSEDCIGFGPKLQLLKNAHFDSENDKVVGIGYPIQCHFTGYEMLDKWMASFEIGFQTLSLHSMLSGKGLSIPLNVGTVKVYGHPEDELRVETEITDLQKNSDQNPLRGNIFGYDKNNHVVFEMLDVQMSKIRNHATLPFKMNKEVVTL